MFNCKRLFNGVCVTIEQNIIVIQFNINTLTIHLISIEYQQSVVSNWQRTMDGFMWPGSTNSIG